MSSAKGMTCLNYFTMLFMLKRNSIGPKTFPCGTPVDMFLLVDLYPSRIVHWDLDAEPGVYSASHAKIMQFLQMNIMTDSVESFREINKGR